MGRAQFTGPKSIVVNSLEYGDIHLTADHIIIATGGAPWMCSIPGAKEHCINNRGFFLLEEMPKTAIIIGNGKIAAEFASVLNALGCDVT